MPRPSALPLLESKQILVLCGAGGVGKTSVSASSMLDRTEYFLSRNSFRLNGSPERSFASR